MKSLFLSTALVSTLFALPGLADVIGLDPNAADSAGEIVVVANRSPETQDRIGNSVTVLDQAAIQASQASALSDLLVQTPGVTFVRNGGEGETTAISIRGAPGDETMVLIDGVRLTDPSAPSGTIDFAHLLVGDAGRIEVLRGPQSTLWGSDAMGGVIDVITAPPTGSFSADGQVEGGSRGTGYARAGVGGTGDLVDWRLAGGYYTTDGIPTLDEKFGGNQPDGYKNGAVNAKALLKLTDNISIDLRGYYIYGRNEYDGFPPPLYELSNYMNYATINEFIDYTGINFDILDGALKNRVAFQYTNIDNKDFDAHLSLPETFTGIGRTTRFEYQGIWAIAENYQAVFGAETQHSSMTTASPSSFDPNPTPNVGAADISSLYAQIEGTVLPGLTLTGGVRGDRHETFGNHATGQVAAAWSFNDKTTILRSSFGQGFKAPSLFQLFSPYGNTGLQPEQDNGWDAGIEQHLLDGQAALQANYFGRNTRNIIEFVSCPGPYPQCATRPFGFYNNVDRAEAEGVELTATANLLPNLTISANYTYTESEDRSPGASTFGKDLARTPRSVANLSGTYVWPFGLTTTVAVRYSGQSFDDAANTVPLASYTLVDLRASYPITDNFELYGRIENLFDKHYETAFMYGQPGRGAFAGISAKF